MQPNTPQPYPLSEENPGKTYGILSLILSIIGFGIIGIILGIIGLKKSKQAGKKNGLALAGLIVGIVSLIIAPIALLGFITAVSYGGITERANVSTSISYAQSAAKKAEAYNAEVGTYPTLEALTSGSPEAAYSGLSLSSFTFEPLTRSTVPNDPSLVEFQRCGVTADGAEPQSLGQIATITGNAILYWDSSNNRTGEIRAGETVVTDGGATVGCFFEPGATPLGE